MAYQVQVDISAREQIRALPAGALKGLAEAMVVLEITPWSGDPLRRDNPDGPLRTLPFGSAGLVTYLILEDEQVSDVVAVLWLG
jgi:hypothetical protein